MNGRRPIRKSPIILYGALLLLSAVIIAGVAAFLLSRDQARLDQAARDAERGRLQNQARQLALAVSVVQDEMLRSLQSIPSDRLLETLREWERTKPLVRNVFVWQGADDLLLPDSSLPLTREEQGFINRYHTLFSGIHEWGDAVQEEQYVSVSQELFVRTKTWEPPVRSGWVPWYWENRLGLIGWMERDGLRYGVELEMVALLSELQQAMPNHMPEDRMVLLLDGGGRRIMQAGSVDDDANPVLSVTVGPSLPHWELVLHTADGTIGPATQGYALLSGLLVLILFIILFSPLAACCCARPFATAPMRSRKPRLSPMFRTNSRHRSPPSECMPNCSEKGAWMIRKNEPAT